MNGASLSTPGNAIPVTEIQGEVNLLEMTISDLENAFETLAQRLDPLLPAPSPVDPMVKGEVSPRNSPLGQTLSRYNVRLNRVLENIHALRNDLHI